MKAGQVVRWRQARRRPLSTTWKVLGCLLAIEVLTAATLLYLTTQVAP